MRIGILGQPCIDEIIQLDASGAPTGPPRPALGGILYSYVGLERLLREEGSPSDRIVPLTWHSRGDAPRLAPLLAACSHLEIGHGLWSTDALTNRVQLVYAADGSRVEHCPTILPPVTLEQLTFELIASLDGLFVNMISGYDIALETLEAALARAPRRPFVHVDVHALVLGELSVAESASENGTAGRHGAGRKPRGVNDWRRWLDVADSVQLNELEAAWFAHPDCRSEASLLHALESERERRRLRYLTVTRGPNGATLYDLRHQEVHHVQAPAATVRDTTGAGDVFGAHLLRSLVAGIVPADALEAAVRFATWCTTLTTIDEILTAPRTL